MKTIAMTPSLYDYLLQKGVREHALLRALRERTAELAERNMQIAADQGALMQMLVKLTGAKRIIEVGTFTGYSALAMAMALPEGGELVACDVSEEWTSIGRKFWEKAGVEDRIQLEIAPALETLDALLERGQKHTFDMAFVDADKENYQAYYERLLTLVRPGGLILLDNVLWGGSIIDESNQEASTVALRKLNDSISRDERVEIVMLPVADGITMARVL